MGEKPESVFVIGSPDIDIMLSQNLPSIEEARDRYAIPFDDYGILIYHPVTTELDRLRHYIQEVLAAAVCSEWNFVVVHPNNDKGSEVILEEFETLGHNSRFRFFPSLRFEYFLTLLNHSQAILGNSSAGVREAPVYGVPTINIGTRQLNRVTPLSSIVNVPDISAEILYAMANLPPRAEPSLLFGNGHSSDNFVAQLLRKELWETPCQKQFQDLTPTSAL
jgi:UDP-N-acetylglucosamine 2-epimerase (hydrolysing)